MARWDVRLSPSAQRDLAKIIDHTVERFGPRQAKVYRKTLMMALAALRSGPRVRDSVLQDNLALGLRSLHVARRGRRGRHQILYREGPDRTIEVLRILHDAMDLKQHFE